MKVILEGKEPWPHGFQYLHKRLYKDFLMCIPLARQPWVVRLHHAATGHPGGERLWHELCRRYFFADPDQAKKHTLQVRNQCGVCQAVGKRRGPWKSKIRSTLIPPYVMDSVAVDLFSMLAADFEGQTYDTMVLCVCRASGYIVATTCLNLGLTAEKCAK